jgi:transcriptional regulator with XRE-family HTH domain
MFARALAIVSTRAYCEVVAKLDVSKLDVRGLGDYIREQRNSAQISLRQLATLAGVSNPYLSQIERGLRKPSAEILQQIAKALRISAEALYVQAGILEQRYIDSDVPTAIFSDPALTERQKAVLLEMYESFRIENAPVEPPASGASDASMASASTGAAGNGSDPAAAAKAAPAKKSSTPRKSARPAAGSSTRPRRPATKT